MVSGKNVLLGVLGLSVILAGCVGLGGGRPLLEQATAPAPRRSAEVKPSPDLRIPTAAVASAQDVPLVPVPPPPLPGDYRPRPTPPAPEAPPSQPAASVTPPPTPPPAVVAPAAANAPAPPADTPRQLYQQAAAWYAGIDSYNVRLRRREDVNGTKQPEEVLLFQFRKEPWSLHFKWLGKVGEGREVLYVKDHYENKIHTRLAAGDMPFVAAGTKMALPIDSILVRSASRHPITDAGIGAAIDRIGAVLDALDKGDKHLGTIADLGMQNRPEFTQPVRGLEHTLPPGAEAELPHGGRRLLFFDPDRRLPLLLIAYDDKNQEVEYYSYDRLQAPVHLDANDFDPEKLWGSPKSATGARSRD